MHPLFRFLSCLLVTAVVLAGGTAPAAAHSHSVTAREPVFGGLVHEHFSVRLVDGSTARGNILRFRQDNPHLQLRQVLARDRIPGLETVPSIAARVLPDDALAGTNGGYWLDRPVGAPNGHSVVDGLLLAGQGAARSGGPRPRASVGLAADGRVVMDQMRTRFELTTPDGTNHPVDEANRNPLADIDPNATGELLVYDPIFGSSAPARANSVVAIVDGLRLRSAGRATGTVRSVAPTPNTRTSVPIPAGANLLIAYGSARSRLAGLVPGMQITVRTVPMPLNTTNDLWGNLTTSVAAGPLLIVNSNNTTPKEWESEAFSTAHLTGRQPRTAIGHTSTGEVMLVTVDGRRQGHSVGMTISELQRFMRGLGSRDAVNLDGGGSTHMMVEGKIWNRPSETGRSVANGLFVYSSYPFEGTRRYQGRDRFGTAATVARRSHPDGATDVIIATGASFPDALAGGPLATDRDAPLLLTARDRLPAATVQALDHLRPQRATILGGTSAVSNQVRDELRARGIIVDRLSGSNRSDTAGAIGEALVDGTESLPRVFVASGAGFADALTAAPPAGMLGAPILLADRASVPTATQTFLSRRDVGEVVIVGGTGVLGRAVEDEIARLKPEATIRRLSGANRYETAGRVNEWAAANIEAHRPTGLIVANGSNFPDALAGGPLAAGWRHLLMIVPPKDVTADAAAAAYLEQRAGGDLNRITLLGGTAALTRYQQWQLDQLAIR
jgi:putative cell wall-binding protein